MVDSDRVDHSEMRHDHGRRLRHRLCAKTDLPRTILFRLDGSQTRGDRLAPENKRALGTDSAGTRGLSHLPVFRPLVLFGHQTGRVRTAPRLVLRNRRSPPYRLCMERRTDISRLGSKTDPENIHKQGSQLCPTNEELFHTFLKRLREQLDANPNATIVSVSQNDWDGYCECEKGIPRSPKRKALRSAILYFVNRIAANWKEPSEHSGRHARLPLLAQTSKHVVARDNVIVRLCSISAPSSRT